MHLYNWKHIMVTQSHKSLELNNDVVMYLDCGAAGNAYRINK